jgi:serine/threonine-protein phosphatase 6 regulatory subunit 3
VFCCEVEAIYNTLMEDDALLGRLFSLLDQPPPLSCKTAGYFGRVVGQLLLKKTNEMMQYLSNNDTILERFIQQIDTASIADVLKRLVGADDQAAMVFLPMHTQWLAETQLVDWLLDRLRSSYAPDVQSNAADILTAIAHTQPSPLSMQLMQQKSIAALFERALEPGGKVLVAALEVCGALLEPMRSQVDPGGSPDGNGNGGLSTSTAGAAAAKARAGAVSVMLEFVPQLVELLQAPADTGATQETPYGLLTPPLGRARLKAVELLAALLRVGEGPADEALITSKALVAVQALFLAYPFNNLLHHQLLELLAAALRRGSGPMLDHLLGPEASLPKWLRGAPKEVTPAPLPGGTTKGPLRAGYLGHITRIANVLAEVAAAREDVAQRLQVDADWQALVAEDVGPRNRLEDVNTWECGRPAATDLNTLDSDEGEYQVRRRLRLG